MRTREVVLLCTSLLAFVGCKKGSGGGGGGGWLVGTEGLMVNVHPSDVSSDHGEYDLGSSEQLESIACRYRAEAWVAGAHGTLLYTSDGGATWDSQTLPTVADLHSIATQDTGPVFIAGDGVLLTSTPAVVTGAATWLNLGDGVTSFRSVAAARHGATVLAVSAEGGVWSYDNGRMIKRTTIEGATAIAVSADGQTALIAGAGLSRSIDGGLTWTSLAIEQGTRFADVRIDDRGEGFAVGASGAMARIDGEGRVLTQKVGSSNLRTVYMPAYEQSDGVGYAAGDGGQIWLTRDGGWSWEAGPNVGRTVLSVDEIGDAHR